MPFIKGVSGNPKGAPKKPEDEQLRLALEKAKKQNGDVSFLEHYCDLAYKDKSVAVALANKILPDLSKSEVETIIREGLMVDRPNGDRVTIGADKGQ